VSTVSELLDGREVCVCAGAGGVGKTTASAAIALAAAAEGRRVAVLTIDPARRLANALGLERLGSDPRRVDDARLARAGIELRGELWAAMLDAKRTFDDVVERYAPDPRSRDAVLANPIYQELSSAIAGSQEYMAMERLYELHAAGDYDLLVLDTPPTRNALDFLDAPERLLGFIDSRALQFFVSGSRAGLKVFSRGTGLVFRLLERLAGSDLLRDLSTFFTSLADMREGFRQRAARVRELLADDRTTFVLVTSPRAHAIDEAVYFRRRLEESGMPFGAAIVNRVLPDPTGLSADLGPGADELLGPALARRVARTWHEHLRLAERDRDSVARLRTELGGAPLLLVPHLDDDVHDLDGLARFNEHLLRAPLG
jgi:anion-transporting  ArsA/GET3 family ATPase